MDARVRVMMSSGLGAEVLGALSGVATAGGTLPMEASARETLSAMGRHVFEDEIPLGPTGAVRLDAIRERADLGAEVVGYGLLFPFLSDADQAARADALVALAGALKVSDRLPRALAHFARGRLGPGMRAMRRAARRAVPGSHPLTSFLMGFRGRLGLDRSRRLADRYARYAELPAGSVGRVLADYYDANRYARPGSPGGWYSRVVASHDAHHVLSGYPTDPLGEICVMAFAHAASRRDLSAIFPFLLFQYDRGLAIDTTEPAVEGHFSPDAFFHAARRGAACRVDLLAPAIDLHRYANTPLAALRAKLGITPPPAWSDD